MFACVCSVPYAADRACSVPSPLDTGVRLAEESQSEHSDEHEEHRDHEERDEQLRSHRRRRARDDADESVVHPEEPRPASRHQTQAVTQPSEAVAPTDDTISHFPLIFCTLWSTPTTFATFPVLMSM